MSEPSNFIQWKGTDVCIDLHCTCGTHNHFDGYFAYALQCYSCDAIWELAIEVPMTKVTESRHRPRRMHE